MGKLLAFLAIFVLTSDALPVKLHPIRKKIPDVFLARFRAAKREAPSPAPPSTVTVDQTACLNAHNTKRALHGVDAMSWDADMAASASAFALTLAWANKDTDVVSLTHSSSSDGENAYYAAKSGDGTFTCADAVNDWYSEIQYYDYSDYTNVPAGKAVGHFTQVVWAASTKLGVGLAKVKHNGMTRTFVVARYRERGNVAGQTNYDTNVPPLV